MQTELFMAPVRTRPSAEPQAPVESTVPMGNPGWVINPKPTGAKTKYQFRLTEGIYVDYNGEKTPENKDGRRIFQTVKKANIFPVIETDQDLTIFNGKAAGMKEKFQRLHINQDVIIQQVDPTVRISGETVTAYLARMVEVTNTLKKQTEAVIRATDSMTLEQLTEYAQAEEIDLKGAKTADEARKIIKIALKG